MAGLVFSIAYWLIESFAHLLFFRDGNLYEWLIPRDPNELMMRILAVAIIMALSIYIAFVRRGEEVLNAEMLEKMSLAVEQSPASVVITDTKGIIQYVNGIFSEITGYSKDEVIGNTQAILKSGETPEAVYKDLWGTISRGAIWQGELLNRKKNGDFYWVDVKISSIKNPQGEITHYVGIKEDITEVKILKERIMASERDLSLMFNNMPDMFFRTNIEGKILIASPSVKDIFGYEPDELLGKSVADFYLYPELRETFFEALNEGGGVVKDFEAQLKCKDGSIIWGASNARYWTDENGDIGGIEGVARNITDRKKAEEELKKYSRELETVNRMKELYIDIMSHDILNPISVIMNASTILTKMENDTSKNEVLQMISEGADDIKDLIDLVKKYSRINTVSELERQELDLNDVLCNTIIAFTLQSEGKTVDIKHVEKEGCIVSANPLIHDVMSNLVSNAIKYGPEGGIVEVGMEEGNDHWVVFVIDQGEGIPDEHKEKIFERFERIERGVIKGTGLGLAIAKRIIDLHDGRIWVEDNPGGGSVFKVSLPMIADDS